MTHLQPLAVAVELAKEPAGPHRLPTGQTRWALAALEGKREVISPFASWAPAHADERTRRAVSWMMDWSMGSLARWSRPRRTQRQADPHRRAFADRALEGHPAPVGLGDAPADRQSPTGAARAGQSSGIDPVEPLVEVRQVLRKRDAFWKRGRCCSAGASGVSDRPPPR